MHYQIIVITHNNDLLNVYRHTQSANRTRAYNRIKDTIKTAPPQVHARKVTRGGMYAINNNLYYITVVSLHKPTPTDKEIIKRYNAAVSEYKQQITIKEKNTRL